MQPVCRKVLIPFAIIGLFLLPFSTTHAAAPTTYTSTRKVKVNGKTFTVTQLKFDLSKGWRLMTDTANTTSCTKNCPTKSLASYIKKRKAVAAIQGSYFCPTDYPACRSKKGQFSFPIFNSFQKKFINQLAIPLTAEPTVAIDTTGHLFMYLETMTFVSSVDFLETFRFESKAIGGSGILQATISNGPALVYQGQNVVGDYPLDQKQKNTHTTRGVLGWKGSAVFLLVVHRATVPDAAAVAKAMKLDFALNLDGGGSTALYANGKYLLGPGRTLPNAILILPKK